MPEFIENTPLEELQKLNAFWTYEDSFQVDTDTTALLLNKSPLTLKAWRSKGIGPEYTRGRPVTYSIGDLKHYIEKQKSRHYRLA